MRMSGEQTEQILQAIKELSDHMNEGFQKNDQRFEEVDKRFEAIDKRFEEIDQRFDAIDKRFEDMDKRFDNMEAKQEKMQNGFDILVKREMDNEADIRGIKKAMGPH